MSGAPGQHRVFKAILRAIVSDEFSFEDYQAAVKKIRDGSLIVLLDQVLGALANSPADSQSQSKASSISSDKAQKRKEDGGIKSADDLFNDVKRRKITREQLEGTLRSIDSGFASRFRSADTMRTLLKLYREHATDREWKMLGSIVNGNYEMDPYLTSISEDYGR